jgi:hypothetical protein
MEYSGAGVKLIHEKNQKQKISWHCPFKVGSIKKISHFQLSFLQVKLKKRKLGMVGDKEQQQQNKLL